jgi:Pectate lyase superfamily protein
MKFKPQLALRALIAVSAAVAVLLVQVSCGGGGGSSNATAVGQPAPAVAPSSPSPTQTFIPSAIAAPRVPDREFLLTTFGALANDDVDDTQAIQAALDAVNAAGGGTLVFPPGRFDIRINPTLSRALTLYPRIRLLGRPAGQATLRLADRQPIYESIMATASYPTRLDDAVFEGLVFDANGLNNPVRNANETNGDLNIPSLRYVIRTFAGSRVLVRNCIFTNNDNGNTLTFNGEAISDVVVENNKFLNVGGALIDHDRRRAHSNCRQRISQPVRRGHLGSTHRH